MNAPRIAPTRISLTALLSRRRNLGHAESTIESWLLEHGWTFDPASPRFPWTAPDDSDSFSLRDAARAQAGVTAARLLKRRGWHVGNHGYCGCSAVWCEGPTSRQQITLGGALRAEDLEAVHLRREGADTAPRAQAQPSERRSTTEGE